jgi:hypothetical protein
MGTRSTTLVSPVSRQRFGTIEKKHDLLGQAGRHVISLNYRLFQDSNQPTFRGPIRQIVAKSPNRQIVANRAKPLNRQIVANRAKPLHENDQRGYPVYSSN